MFRKSGCASYKIIFIFKHLALQSSVDVEFVAVVFDATRPNFFFSCAPLTPQLAQWSAEPVSVTFSQS